MRLFDTHCHFETSDASVIGDALVRARDAGVEMVMAVGGSKALNKSAMVARSIADADLTLPRVVIALGYDREQIDTDVRVDNGDMYLSQQMTALGEIGLDYHYSPETRDAQMALFSRQLALAMERNLPVVIHTREADDDTLALLREIPSRGIIHCYTGSADAAKRYLDLGFFISISGIVTFRAAENVRDVARMIPDDRLLIETDSPFLAPVPMRGHANEPAFIRHTCEFLAKVRGIDSESLARTTFCNAFSAVSLPPHLV